MVEIIRAQLVTRVLVRRNRYGKPGVGVNISPLTRCRVPTEPSISRDRVFRFGPFELSEREGELRKGGVRIKLQE